MRRAAGLATILLVIIAAAAPSGARTIQMDEEVELEHRPDHLRLAPGDSATVVLVLRNRGAEPVNVSIVHQGIEGPGGCRAVIDPSFLTVPAGQEERVRVVITTAPLGEMIDGGGPASDFRLRLDWGPNLTTYAGTQMVDPGTADGSSRVTIPVSVDLTWTCIIPVVVVIALLAMALAYPVIRGRRRDGQAGGVRDDRGGG